MLRNLIKKLVKVGCYLIGKFTGSNHIPVFTYHSIDTSKSVLSVSPDTLRKQFEFFRDNGYEPLSLEDYFQYKKQNKSLKNKFLITFDDGYQNLYTHAFPLLKEFSYPAVVFLVTDYVGKTASWIIRDEKIILDRLLPTLSESEVDIEAEKNKLHKTSTYPLLNWEEIEEMSAGGVDFQSHTNTHPFISTLNEQDLENELTRSREIIEKRLNNKVTGFCYPYCDYENPQVSRLLSENGYAGAFVGDQLNGKNQKPDKFHIIRIAVWEFTTYFDLKFFFSPGYRVYKSIAKLAKGKQVYS
ncbi:MAG: polysaccharide deacetylase family protein [Candidatus Nitronauta litoralis]|uniref:Polysaccharide deacetylase family protein n=1 Tax=Candidatus Nitronauta litoralis TaxID=2705533 RepID=A0A7T0G150_9BACT|nr:MAG: polysaccharide deacetylase family protein [Candidatus Nitronauta litoralis]